VNLNFILEAQVCELCAAIFPCVNLVAKEGIMMAIRSTNSLVAVAIFVATVCLVTYRSAMSGTRYVEIPIPFPLGEPLTELIVMAV
jgi:hypothetical protein